MQLKPGIIGHKKSPKSLLPLIPRESRFEDFLKLIR